MDLRASIRKLSFAMVLVLFALSIVGYGIVGVYFFIGGVQLQSGGGILLGLACWCGVALFSLPFWLLFALRLQKETLRQQNAHLHSVVETLRDESKFREISRAMTAKDMEFYE
jgi:hypothetical protein